MSMSATAYTAFKYFRNGDSTVSLDSLFQCLTTISVKIFFPKIHSKPPLSQLEAILSCSVTCYMGEGTNAQLATTSFQIGVESKMVSPGNPSSHLSSRSHLFSLPSELWLWGQQSRAGASVLGDLTGRRRVHEGNWGQSCTATFSSVSYAMAWVICLGRCCHLLPAFLLYHFLITFEDGKRNVKFWKKLRAQCQFPDIFFCGMFMVPVESLQCFPRPSLSWWLIQTEVTW